MVEKDGQVKGLGGLVQVEEKRRRATPVWKPMEKKSSQTAASRQNPKQESRWIRKEAKGSQCAGKRGGDRATSRVRQDCHVVDEKKTALKKAAGVSERKDECQVRLTGK